MPLQPHQDPFSTRCPLPRTPVYKGMKKSRSSTLRPFVRDLCHYLGAARALLYALLRERYLALLGLF
jgi:hypothetical protein